jgi:hypothetical protein
VTIVETNAYTSMTCTARLRAVASSQESGHNWGIAQLERMRTSETSGLGAVHAAPGYVAIKGTTVSAIAPTARKANVLLPISDVVVFDGFAGIRSWSPPV